MSISRPEFSTRAYYDQVYAALTPAFAWRASTVDEWRTWRAGLTRQLTELLGGFPAERGPLNPRVVERVETARYVREKVIFDSEPGVAVPAYLLLPKGLPAGRPAPALLCLHGHGRGKDDVVGLAPTLKERQQRIRPYNYDYGHQFAERGYIVLAPDARQFGERAADGMSCTWAMTAGLLLGKVLVGLRVWDALRALDYLQTRPEVDPARLGCVGLSWGGTHTLYTSALDERIKVAIVSGYFDSFKDNLIDAGCCPCQYVPNLLRYAEMTDLIGLLAPRPLLIENGSEDPLYTEEVVRQEYPKVERVYALLDAADRLALDLFPGHHRFSGRLAFDWMERWL
jgi:dienelactone hydrolase